jgi:hypothetical protein
LLFLTLDSYLDLSDNMLKKKKVSGVSVQVSGISDSPS